MVKCRVCNIELTNENWWNSFKKIGSKICKTCRKKYMQNYSEKNNIILKEKKKEYYINNSNIIKEKQFVYKEKNKEKINQRIKNYSRKYYINTRDGDGNRIKIKCEKKDYPSNNECELCKRIRKRLSYHHWDDDKPWLGMWLCNTCHFTAENIDKNLHCNYLLIKSKIEKDCYESL